MYSAKIYFTVKKKIQTKYIIVIVNDTTIDFQGHFFIILVNVAMKFAWKQSWDFRITERVERFNDQLNFRGN